MNTPVYDFVNKYKTGGSVRLHMPGHKGMGGLGCEKLDITEIAGADELYDAEGIIAEAEDNTSKLYGSGRTLWSAEGSSQCIRAMLYLAVYGIKNTSGERPVILAARNVHKAFLYGCALLDIHAEWIYPAESSGSICGSPVTADDVAAAIDRLDSLPAAVYITSPDYLGAMADIKGISEACHQRGVMLLVDNAHGAYLNFLPESLHPLSLGADVCSDSAHKTLPVLTGGAYLHISDSAPAGLQEKAKQAMAIFGSTSPSYLIMQSLDLCNRYISDGYRERLEKFIEKLDSLRNSLQSYGWQLYPSDPLRLTVSSDAISGHELAERLRRDYNIEAEYADSRYAVLMLTIENQADLGCIDEAFKLIGQDLQGRPALEQGRPLPYPVCPVRMSIREAILSDYEEVSPRKALGRICAAPAVACPPAIPIAVSGEEITALASDWFISCGINKVLVVKQG